ncbi:uncharacterized protein RHO25_013168 [Cercospora beticola]|uniref:Uncharacterized protein n=1 Tax=Cercospora beticola TaxID=122368 RepID=A0ABZ0P9B0_CERBT|nr:hypothetical protein RHO25_013168 [Cercospora beticola]CAK1356635.1 unnamed protein product [Cercospora beticola]
MFVREEQRSRRISEVGYFGELPALPPLPADTNNTKEEDECTAITARLARCKSTVEWDEQSRTFLAWCTRLLKHIRICADAAATSANAIDANSAAIADIQDKLARTQNFLAQPELDDDLIHSLQQRLSQLQ